MTPVLDRLVGLETEYALRFQPAVSVEPALPRFRLYQSVLAALRDRLPVVRASHFKEGAFLGNGGAVWFETERLASDGGLIEGSTPECRGPRQVLTYQLAQDRLLSESAAATGLNGPLQLIKNCRDSRGNVYGAQENYEAVLAGGWRLVVWRAGLVALLPLVLLTWLGLLLIILGILVYLAAAGVVYLCVASWSARRLRWAVALFGRDLAEGRDCGSPLPAWLEWLILWAARVAGGPLALGLWLLAQLTAFGAARRQLLAFFVSRSVLGGSGSIDQQGSFQLAEKAAAINCLVGFGGYLWDRPLFNFGHLFKAVSLETFLRPGDYAGLFASRQRLQINLGDSNMCPSAQFLRVGTTLLVLDALEAGYLAAAPRVRRPIRALHRLAADATLQASVPLCGGGSATAVELQRLYQQACRRFLEDQADVPAEAWEVLDRWTLALDSLEQQPEELVGVIDWVTKRFLLREAGRDADYGALKKIDIRYHELSAEGYFQLLARTGLVANLIDEAAIERAMRTAPPDTPATTRGQFIREFAGGDRPLSANWRRVIIGRGRAAKVVRLDRYRRSGRAT